MGQEIEQEEFSAADHEKFGQQLHRDLAALEVVLQRPRFGAGKPPSASSSR